MEKIDVRARRGNLNCARHAVTSFEQWPVERFPIEGDEHAALRYALGQRHQQRMLLAWLAHEKLLDFEAARVPPGDADQEGIGASASREARGLGIEEKPLRGVAYFLGRAEGE